MKANKATLGRTLDDPDPGVRLYLFYGQDDSGSRALAERLLAGLKAEKTAIAGSALKNDPGLLAGEAGAISLFGERRAIWIEPAGDELTVAAEALLDVPAVENPAIMVAGALRKSSSLLKLAEAGTAAIAHPSYPLEGREAERLVIDLARSEGLRMAGDVATRVAAAANNNQAIVASELRKFALFLGAGADAPRELDHEVIDRLGADSGEGDWMRLGDLALDGRLKDLVEQLQCVSLGAAETVPIVRSLQRRVLQLAPLRARIEHGERLDDVVASMGKSLFWKDKPIIQRLLSQWSAARLAQLGERISRLERQLMLTPVPGGTALGEELIAIARAVRR
ncbi:MAG: DNA polymerase III subunit delta [Sphingomonadales bacterium]|nr:DNA polymerase III subunit delta [Sphingomonadales bacterium]